MKFGTVALLLLLSVLFYLCEGRRQHKRARHGSLRADGSSRTDRWSQLYGRPFVRDGQRWGYRWADRQLPWWFSVDFGTTQTGGWWKGPNVCETVEEDDSNSTSPEISHHYSYQSSTCDVTDSAYKCVTEMTENGQTKKKTTVMECCAGFARKEGEHGCPREFSMKNLIDTMKGMQLNEFVRAIQATHGMAKELNKGEFTVFAPVDDVMKNFDDFDNVPEIRLQDEPNVLILSKPIKETVINGMQDTILRHVVPGTMRSSSMNDEQLIQTSSSDKSKIRINYYSTPEKLMTANCIKVVQQDKLATNGVIHKLAEVLEPVPGSLADLIGKNPDLSNMKTLIGKSGLSKELRGPGQFTVFAPTDEAFRKMEAGLRHRFVWQNKCIDEVLRGHILGNVICSTAIQGRARSKNLLGDFLNLTRDDNDKIFVEGKQVLIKDKMATNGVLYIIEDIIIPDKAYDVLETAKREGGSKFVRLIKDAELTDDILSQENITLFVPSDDAFKQLSEEELKLVDSGRDGIQSLVGYHVATQREDCRGIRNNALIDTMNGKQLRYNENSPWWFFSQRRIKTIQCVPISNPDVEACGGNVNIINSLIIPPVGDVIDVLGQDNRFSKFVSYLKKTGLADELQKTGPFTVFAPTNEAFEKFGQSKFSDLEDAKDIILNHIAGDALCCAGVFSQRILRQQIRVESGKRFPLGIGENNLPTLGHANFLSCDITATNGVVHAIDHVVVHEHRRGRRRKHRRRKQRDWWSGIF